MIPSCRVIFMIMSYEVKSPRLESAKAVRAQCSQVLVSIDSAHQLQRADIRSPYGLLVAP